jgi:hypothetical protein
MGERIPAHVAGAIDESGVDRLVAPAEFRRRDGSSAYRRTWREANQEFRYWVTAHPKAYPGAEFQVAIGVRIAIPRVEAALRRYAADQARRLAIGLTVGGPAEFLLTKAEVPRFYGERRVWLAERREDLPRVIAATSPFVEAVLLPNFDSLGTPEGLIEGFERQEKPPLLATETP